MTDTFVSETLLNTHEHLNLHTLVFSKCKKNHKFYFNKNFQNLNNTIKVEFFK